MSQTLCVPEGYKLTEVGVIPGDWEVKRIGDLAMVGSGGTPSRKNPAFWDGSIPWVTTSQIDFGTINWADQFITDDGLQNSAAKLLPEGTLLLALYGQGKTRGKVAILGFAAATNQACASISLFGNTSREYFLHYLASQYEALRSSSNTGSQENLNGQIVKDFPVICPPPVEQRAIAAALSDVDALLAKLDQLIAKKQGLKQAAMQQLLTGQTRLPGFSGEWEVKRLGDVADIDPENLSSSTSSQYFFKYISLEDVDSGSLKSYSEQVFSTSPSRARRRLQVGDVLVSTVRPNLMSHLLFQENGADWICSTGFAVVRCHKEKAHSGFFFAHMFGRLISRQIETLVTGSNYPAINSRDVRAFELPMPSYAEQTAIATILSDMDAELAALEARRDKTRALKQGMMQALLTGRIRLV